MRDTLTQKARGYLRSPGGIFASQGFTRPMPKVGFEPTRGLPPAVFETAAYSVPPLRPTTSISQSLWIVKCLCRPASPAEIRCLEHAHALSGPPRPTCSGGICAIRLLLTDSHRASRLFRHGQAPGSRSLTEDEGKAIILVDPVCLAQSRSVTSARGSETPLSVGYVRVKDVSGEHSTVSATSTESRCW